MCGIAGILRLRPPGNPGQEAPTPAHWLNLLDDGIRHRGPDGNGRLTTSVRRTDGLTADVTLLHRRLSILDLEDGAQPMSLGSPHPAISLVFNGCIYNHRTLRAELATAGARFTTNHSDTEVILQGWLLWQHKILERLDGMFALALFDHRSGEFVLARDSMGEKPLYTLELFAASGSSLIAFASSPAPLLRLHHLAAPELGCRPPSIEPSSLAEWVRFGFGHSTPFSSIHSLRPGAASIWGANLTDPDSGRPTTTSFLDFRPPAVDHPGRGSPLSLDHLDSALRAAVTSRLDSDVPIGCFLSGGIDSALVAAYAARHTPSLPTFTVRMPDPTLDESPEAAETARALGLPHQILDCDPHPAEDLERLISTLGLPFADSSLLPTTWVSRAARQHVTVALSGDGGDELFLGYDRQQAARSLLPLMSRLGPGLCAAAARALDPASPSRWRSRAARLLSAAAHGYEDLLGIFPGTQLPELGLPRWPPASGIPPSIERARLVDLTTYLPQDLLRKSDTASMAVALEVRAPFLARDVVQLAAATPAAWLAGRGRKWVLRELASRYLPASVLNRPKRGFAIPIGRWFRENWGGLGDMLGDVVHSADPWSGAQIGFELHPAAVRRMFESHQSGTRDHSQRLYGILILAVWTRWLKSLQPGRHP